MKNTTGKKTRFASSQTGFTLIELLVVIAIIGLLASVVLVSVNKGRIKARDARRAADLSQITKALELYNSDHGSYPISDYINNYDPLVGSWTCFDCTNASFRNRGIMDNNGNLIFSSIGQAMSAYIAGSVKDPYNPNPDVNGYFYRSDPGGAGYKLIALRTPEDLRDFSPNMIDPARCGGFNQNTGICNQNGTLGVGQPATMSIGFWTNSQLVNGQIPIEW